MTRALVLHAHPDDELLFAGALMLAHPDWEWTTVSLTGGPRRSRYPGICLGFPDEWRILSVAEYHEWRAAVAALRLEPDVTISHNMLGEYGHPHHMAVHRIAHELFAPVWDFLVQAESSVLQQNWRAWVGLTNVGPDKERRFGEVYGADVLDELRRDRPAMMADLFEGELVTGERALPERAGM